MNSLKYIWLALYFFLIGCNSNYFDRIAKNDIGLGKPRSGEWLYEHKELGQSFNEFEKSKHVLPDTNRCIIYLQPIGSFNTLENQKIIQATQYLKAFFQLEVVVKPTTNDGVIPKEYRRTRAEGFEQLMTSYILDSVLLLQKNAREIVTMAITQKDLYPKEEWNYVFGLASYEHRKGVTSIYRFNKKTNGDTSNIALLRLIKTSSHEIGHMFGLHHCIFATCVMNGSNTLSELDATSIRLCSLCQRKLCSSIQYNSEKRLLELLTFFKENRCANEYTLLLQDSKI